jgi:hypothetical protein
MDRFPKFHKKHGPSFDCQGVPQEAFDRYADKLPADLFEEWRQRGWCGHGDGFFWTADPAELDDLLSGWFTDSIQRYAFVRTAFGGLFYWDGTDAQYLDVLLGDTSTVFGRMDMLFDGLFCDVGYLNDVLRHDVFLEALPRLGRLKKDECYAYTPPLAMGGPGTVDTLRRVKLREHLAILAQLQSD